MSVLQVIVNGTVFDLEPSDIEFSPDIFKDENLRNENNQLVITTGYKKEEITLDDLPTRIFEYQLFTDKTFERYLKIARDPNHDFEGICGIEEVQMSNLLEYMGNNVMIEKFADHFIDNEDFQNVLTKNLPKFMLTRHGML